MMKVAWIHSKKEAVNFMLGKVPDPWMTHYVYVDHISSSHTSARNSPHAIVPYILAHEYPAGRQRIDDNGASLSGDAFFEVKSYQPNNTRLDHNNKETKPADRRASEVINQYSNKFKRLDKQYAADIVGNGENGIVCPFESAQKRFIGGQVIPLVVGPFGEVNQDFEKVLKTLARLAAAGEDGMSSISPLCNTDRKGGAFIIMLQQFRRALGVVVVRGMANHKLSRLHYVRATAEEAKFTAEATIVIIDGKLGSRRVAAGILAIHQRDRQMETTSAHFRRVLQDLFALETKIITYRFNT
eukprot:scaffold64216_cov67-Cyclotella_meneghiniana.AAC.1